MECGRRSPQTRGLEASNQPEGVKGRIQTFTQLAADNPSWPSDRVGEPQVSQLGVRWGVSFGCGRDMGSWESVLTYTDMLWLEIWGNFRQTQYKTRKSRWWQGSALCESGAWRQVREQVRGLGALDLSELQV